MKLSNHTSPHRFLFSTLLIMLVSMLSSLVANAHPFASGITPTNNSGFVTFILNEDGGNVTITYEDGSTNGTPGFDGVSPGSVNLPKGSYSFLLESPHTSYRISVFKAGNGVPFLISSDSHTNSQYGVPGTDNFLRGIGAMKSTTNGADFGSVAVCSTTTAGTGANAKSVGLYLLNADESFRGLFGANWFVNSAGSGPYRCRAQDDGSWLVTDFSTAQAAVWQYSGDMTSSNLLLGPINQNVAVAAGVHGDMMGGAVMKGSLATGDLRLYTWDGGMGTPSDTNCIKGPLTGSGSFNCIFMYYIGAGPIGSGGWQKRPDYAYTMGLDGIAELQDGGTIGNDGKPITVYGRANGSNPDVTFLRPFLTTNGITGDIANKAVQDAARDSTNWLYTSGVYNPPGNFPPPGGVSTDPFAGINGSGNNVGAYGGGAVSFDGRFFATEDVQNGITICNLTNGLPNEGTIFGIKNAPNSNTGRGIDFDAADNIWVSSSRNQNLIRCYSLGLTTTCVTSNDYTGMHNSFELQLPPAQASVATLNGLASQNYTNNVVNPGAPIPGMLRISLNVSSNASPVLVGFIRSGSAVYGPSPTGNYIINTNETPNGVTILPDGVLFPAGSFSGSNGPNWNVDVAFTPTEIPVSGPITVINVRLTSGTNYSAQGQIASIAILNTGPQLVNLSASPIATSMNRGITGDSARFILTRLGDTNGPGNDAVNPIVARPLVITNFNYIQPATGPAFFAQPGVDFTALAQKATTGLPVNSSSSSITINPGESVVTGIIGNPVKHTNINLTKTNLIVNINLTNAAPLVDANNQPYTVNTTTVALTEFDNALGGEFVIWSNPLTNQYDSTNWTLAYSAGWQTYTNSTDPNFFGSPVLPTVVSNYDNSLTNIGVGPVYAWFGKPVNDPDNDFGAFGGIIVPQSATMLANGWSNALKVTVNKAGNQGEEGINLYPQIPGITYNPTNPVESNYMIFKGNYALRFDMYLSLYDFGLFNGAIGTPAREYAAFGINHYGTNVNWRLDVNPRLDGAGNRPVNADGEWCVINAASGAITPADYDMFISPSFMPDTNVLVVPYTTLTRASTPTTNAFKNNGGTFPGVTNIFANGGVPNDQVSGNNNSVGGTPAVPNSTQSGVIKSPPFGGINHNGGAPDNGWIDVSLEVSRQTNFAMKVAQTVIMSSSLTNPPAGTANQLAPFQGTPMLGYLDPNQDRVDASAFVYYSNMRLVELSPFIPWTNQPIAGVIVTQGGTFSLTSGATYAGAGATAGLTNIWYRGTTNGPSRLGQQDNGTIGAVVFAGVSDNNTNTASVTNTGTIVFPGATNGITTLTVTNVGLPGTNYIATWTDPAGTVQGFNTIVEVIGGTTVINAKATNGTSLASMAVTASGNAAPTSFQWKRNGANLANGTKYAGVTTATLFITNVTPADAGLYSNVVVNPFGSVIAVRQLNVNVGPNVATVSPSPLTTNWGAPVTFTVTATNNAFANGVVSPAPAYTWKKGGVNMADGGPISGATSSALSIAAGTINQSTYGGVGNAYSVGVTNSASGVLSSSAQLTVVLQPHQFGNVVYSPTSVALSFTSSNSWDTTSAFTLQSAGDVMGPYTNEPTALFSGSAGVFSVTATNDGTGQKFYRLVHSN